MVFFPEKNKHSLASRRGQTIVEGMVAVTVLVTGFLGVVTLLVTSLGINRTVTDNYQGGFLASEGVEIIKNIIDANIIAGRAWNANLPDGDYEVQYDTTADLAPPPAYSGRKLAFDPRTHLYSYAGAQSMPFTRRIRITNLPGGLEMQVNSIVTVTSRGEQLDINVEDHFFHWRP